MSSSYEDIIFLSRPISEKYPKMSIHQRAAQFLPFAALTGYEAAIAETGRLTEPFRELDDNRKEVLDAKLQELQHRLAEQPKACVTYFEPDAKKAGGAYHTVSGIIMNIDHLRHVLRMESGEIIPIDYIFDVSIE